MLLRVDKLEKYYGEFCALDEVSFSIQEDEFVSIVGPNGAGKTTLINAITGSFPPDSGNVLFKGKDITGISSKKLSKLGVARSFQLVNIFPDLTVLDSLKVAIVSRRGKGSRIFSSLAQYGEIDREVNELMELYGFGNHRQKLARNLPHGDKKLLDIASAFALHPQIIFLDEPTSGVSTGQKEEIMDTLVSAARKTGIKAIIQVEHDTDLVFSFSDRIIALHKGKIIADGTPEEIKGDKDTMSTIAGKTE